MFFFIYCKLADNRSLAWRVTREEPGQQLPLNLLQVHSTSALCSSSHPLIDETRRSCCFHCRLSLPQSLWLHPVFVPFEESPKLLPVPPLRVLASIPHSFALLPVYLVCWPPRWWERLEEVLCSFPSRFEGLKGHQQSQQVLETLYQKAEQLDQVLDIKSISFIFHSRSR